jgi:hypothetical protein
MTAPYIFGNESSPIPLSQLDANFAAIPAFANTASNVSASAQPAITSVGTLTSLSVAGNVTAGNVSTGVLTANSISAHGNIVTNNSISVYGTITGSNVQVPGTVFTTTLAASGQIGTTGNVSGGNLLTTGSISAAGSINTQGAISATGNIVTAQYFIGNFQGNITGNISVGGSNTQVLFNNRGNVGAAGGLTYNSGSNTLGVLGVVSSYGSSIAGNLSVSGVTQLTGVATAPTAPTGTANNQIATTAFVNNQIGSTAGRVGTLNWALVQIGTTLYFQFNGANVAKLDQLGNFTTTGDVTAFGVI